MRKIRYGLVVLSMLACMGTSAEAEVGVSIGVYSTNVSIGINISDYPELAPVPGYPVYYAPRLYANYFFYDGLFWVYQDDFWFASYWFNGPWWYVEPEFVPLFILRVPVFYYMRPPRHFHGWHVRRPPRWGEHWGHEWERRRSGWDRWDSRSVPPPAPLPVYQRKYSGAKYPRVEEQHELRNRYYRYQPRDTAVRDYVQPRVERKALGPAQPGKSKAPPLRGQLQPDTRYSKPLEQRGPAVPGAPPRSGVENRQRQAPASTQNGGQKERQRQPDSRYSRPSGQSSPTRPGSPPQRGVESRQRQAPDQAPPQQRGPALQDQRRQPGDDQRERKQMTPRTYDQEQRSLDRGEPQEPKRGYWPGQRKDD